MTFPRVPEQRLDPPFDENPAFNDLSDDEIEDIESRTASTREDEYKERRKGIW